MTTTESLTTPSQLASSDDVLLQVQDLKTYFPVRKGVFSRIVGWVKAVDGVSLTVRRGKTLGLVGESGCGKTTVGRTILRLIPATAGKVIFEGKDLFSLSKSEMRAVRRNMQIIFQDPYGSLNPRMTVGAIVGEALSIHGIARGEAKRKRVQQLLELVGLSPDHINRYPHEFSGGQRQRIGVARSLALNPKFIVCDEPVSALDVSIQSQIINLMVDLQQRLNLSYLFISHDLSVVEHVADDVAVMYLGRIVESASSEELYRNPSHPYTIALLSAVPVPDPRTKRRRIVLGGEVPSPINPPSGCTFHPRCSICRGDRRCMNEPPPLRQHLPGHWVACWKAEQTKELLVNQSDVGRGVDTPKTSS